MKSSQRKRVVFGIDDSLPARVAASILRNQDFDLLAVHLRCDLAALGEDPEIYPSAMAPSDLGAIERYCESLGVPLKCIDVTEETLAKVYNPFWIATLTGGRFAASAAWARDILFPHLESVASARSADRLSTGHFARLAPELYRYSEADFDQSRTLARLDRSTLAKLNLPVGDVSTEMLLRLAREIGATPKDENGFSLEREMTALRSARASRGRWEWADAQLADPRTQARVAGGYFKPGPLTGDEDFAVGDHRGIPYYQIGSRAPQHTGYFVREIVAQSRTLVVAREAALAVDTVIAHDLVWTEDRGAGAHRERRVSVEKEPANRRVPAIGPERVSARLLEYPGGFVDLRLESPLYGLSRGETLVFFEESRVLGSAIVAESRESTAAEKAIENPVAPA